MGKYDREYYLKNRERYIANAKKWSKEHPDKVRVYRRSPQMNAKKAASKVIRKALKKDRDQDVYKPTISCTGKEFAAHIQKQWKPGMSWENYGNDGWVVDHIIPVVRFDLTDIEQRRRCNHHSNLQPLWDNENKTKATRMV